MSLLGPGRTTPIELARQLGKSKDTILRWVEKGKLPEPSRDSRGWRYWTPEQIDEIIRAIHRPKR